MLYLSDQPNNTAREACEFVTDNPQEIKIIDYLHQHSQTLIQLNNYLIRNFRELLPVTRPGDSLLVLIRNTKASTKPYRRLNS